MLASWLVNIRFWPLSARSRSIVLSDVPTCAEAILPRGQENGRRAYRQYGQGLRRTHAAKALGPPGCAAAADRGVAALARCARIALRAAPGGADAPQRNAGWVDLAARCSRGKENKLTIRGEKHTSDVATDAVLYRGIAARSFERTFQRWCQTVSSMSPIRKNIQFCGQY
jgi:hypothetical protein